MSDPGTTYRSRDEVQQVRSERDAIAGLKKYILEWGATDEASLKAIDKAAKEEVDVAVAEAKESPQPDLAEFWKDIYVNTLLFHNISPADQISTRVPSPLSCVDVRRRRSTTTRCSTDLRYSSFFHASGSPDLLIGIRGLHCLLITMQLQKNSRRLEGHYQNPPGESWSGQTPECASSSTAELVCVE